MNGHRYSRSNVWQGFILFVAIYFGLYALMLDRKVYRPTGVDPISGQNLFHIEPQYRQRGRLVSVVLAPAHHLDRWLRQTFWTTIDHTNGGKWKNPTAAATATP